MSRINKKAFSAATDATAGEFPPESGITYDVLQRLCVAYYEAAKAPATQQPVDLPAGERFYPEVSKAFNKWLRIADGNPLIMRNPAFEAFLAGWQTRQKRESVDEWHPIGTIPPETTVYLKNAKGEIDTGHWYWFLDERNNPSKEGDIASTQGFGDYTHWKPLDEQGRRG